jgi:hypothetical protein
MIGIYAPYSWSRDTELAIGLADYLTRLGLPVSYYAFGNISQGVHPDWDQKVVNGKKIPFGWWVRRCSHVVMTACHINKLIAAKDLEKKCSLILLLDHIDQYTPIALSEFENVFCPSHYVAALLNRRWATNKIQALPWDPCLPLLRKAAYTSKGTVWAYVPVPPKSVIRFGSKLFYSLQVVMSEVPNLYVTVSHQRRWDKASLEALRELQYQNRDRFRLVSKPSHAQRISLYRTHDFTYYLHSQDEVGLTALESLCAGSPVVTPDSDTLSDIVVPKHNGILLPCDLAQNALDIPMVPELSPGALVRSLTRLTQDTNWLQELEGTPWPELENRRRLFQASWAGTFVSLA